VPGSQPARSPGILARTDWNWILVALLTVFAVAPLTYPGFFEAQSGFLPAFHVEHLSDAPNWGRIAEPLRGEGKLPYLLVRPFYELSGSGVAAVKWGYGLTFLLGALGIYAWTRHWLGTRGGVLAAVVYTYLPWHLGTVYVRGAYAEAWLWALWPPLFWAIDRLNEHRLPAALAALIVGSPLLAALFWTQPGLAVLTLPLLLAYGAVGPGRGPWPLLRLVEASALMLLLLWIAARRLGEAQIPFRDQFLHPFQLLSAAWGDGPPYQLGLAAVGLSMVAVALWVTSRGGGTGESQAEPSTTADLAVSLGRALGFWVAALVALVLLSLPLSAFVWQATGLERFLTYPWQVLALAGLPLAFLAGSVIRLDERLATLPAWAGLVALVVLASYPYLAPRFTQIDPGPEPVAMFQPVEADAPQIVLLDYEVALPTETTPTLTLTLTWQAVAPVEGDYTVFVHALAEDGTKVAQRDTRPCNGECPTPTWQPGEIITDRYQLALAPDAPASPSRLAVGLYLLESGDRATVVGRDDRTVFLDVR
jgi:hypothetical protein